MSAKKYEIIQFYSDTLAGTIGEYVKEWTDPSGCKWIKLYFGKNAGGQKMFKSYPNDVLSQI